MRLLEQVRTAFLYRSVVQELRALRKSHEQQTQLLQRLADHVAPTRPLAKPEELADTGLSYVRIEDQEEVQAIIDAATAAGRPIPSDEEIDRLLANRASHLGRGGA